MWRRSAEAVDATRNLKGKDTGWNGNRDDLREVAKQIEGLSAAEIGPVP